MSLFSRKLWCMAGILCLGVLCRAAATQDLKKTLVQAVEFSLNATFESVAPVDGGKVFDQIKIYSSKGRLRVETVVDQVQRDQVILIPAPPAKKEYVWLVSNGGALKNIVIERHFPADFSWWPIVYALVNSSYIEDARLSVQDSSYGTIPSYKITVAKGDNTALETLSPWLFKYQTIRNLFRSNPGIRYRNFTSEEFTKNKNELQDNFFAVIELWIGKAADRPFIYKYRALNKKGVVIASGNWGKISFPPQIDPKLFEVPPEARVKIVESPEEQGRVYIGNFTAGEIKPPSAIARMLAKVGQGIGAFFCSIGLWLLHNGGWFFAALSGVSLAAVLIVKLKNK